MPSKQPGGLDATLEHREERALSTLVRRVLARHQGDVRGCARELLALGEVESRKERNATDLLGRHHDRALWSGSRAPESVLMPPDGRDHCFARLPPTRVAAQGAAKTERYWVCVWPRSSLSVPIQAVRSAAARARATGGVEAARPCPSCGRGCYGWLGAVEAPNP
jgi:hypothetical protein